VRERAPEASPRLDRSADDHELRPTLVRHACDLFTEQAVARSDDLPPHADAVRPRYRLGRVDPATQFAKLSVETCVEGQLALEEKRCDKDNPRAAVRGEPAREIERVLRLLLLEQRYDHRPIRDGAGSTRKPPRTAMHQPEINGQSHRITWYGTEARMTCFSKRSSRLT
jgi:hypothetical protein